MNEIEAKFTVDGNPIGIIRENLPITNAEKESGTIGAGFSEFKFSSSIEDIGHIGHIDLLEPECSDVEFGVYKFYMRRGRTYYFRNKYQKGSFRMNERIQLKVGSLIKFGFNSF